MTNFLKKVNDFVTPNERDIKSLKVYSNLNCKEPCREFYRRKIMWWTALLYEKKGRSLAGNRIRKLSDVLIQKNSLIHERITHMRSLAITEPETRKFLCHKTLNVIFTFETFTFSSHSLANNTFRGAKSSCTIIGWSDNQLVAPRNDTRIMNMCSHLFLVRS